MAVPVSLAVPAVDLGARATLSRGLVQQTTGRHRAGQNGQADQRPGGVNLDRYRAGRLLPRGLPGAGRRGLDKIALAQRQRKVVEGLAQNVSLPGVHFAQPAVSFWRLATLGCDLGQGSLDVGRWLQPPGDQVQARRERDLDRVRRLGRELYLVEFTVILPQEFGCGGGRVPIHAEGSGLARPHAGYRRADRGVLTIDVHGTVAASGTHLNAAHHVVPRADHLDDGTHRGLSPIQLDRAVGYAERGGIGHRGTTLRLQAKVPQPYRDESGQHKDDGRYLDPKDADQEPFARHFHLF